jgi:hypothetical protein
MVERCLTGEPRGRAALLARGIDTRLKQYRSTKLGANLRTDPVSRYPSIGERDSFVNAWSSDSGGPADTVRINRLSYRLAVDAPIPV